MNFIGVTVRFEGFDPPSPYLLRPWAMAGKKASAGKGLDVFIFRHLHRSFVQNQFELGITAWGSRACSGI